MESRDRPADPALMTRALESLAEADREILALRQFEQLSKRRTSWASTRRRPASDTCGSSTDCGGPSRQRVARARASYSAARRTQNRSRGASPRTRASMRTRRGAASAENRQGLIRQVLESQAKAPSKLRSGVPRDLETIVMKAIAREPEGRYATAEALREDLQRFLEGRPVVARPVGWWGQASRWARRNPVVAALAALLLVTTTRPPRKTSPRTGCTSSIRWPRGWSRSSSARQREPTRTTPCPAVPASNGEPFPWGPPTKSRFASAKGS